MSERGAGSKFKARVKNSVIRLSMRSPGCRSLLSVRSVLSGSRGYLIGGVLWFIFPK